MHACIKITETGTQWLLVGGRWVLFHTFDTCIPFVQRDDAHFFFFFVFCDYGIGSFDRLHPCCVSLEGRGGYVYGLDSFGA